MEMIDVHVHVVCFMCIMIKLYNIVNVRMIKCTVHETGLVSSTAADNHIGRYTHAQVQSFILFLTENTQRSYLYRHFIQPLHGLSVSTRTGTQHSPQPIRMVCGCDACYRVVAWCGEERGGVAYLVVWGR